MVNDTLKYMEELIEGQIEKYSRPEEEYLDFKSLDKIRIGILSGDGIGPRIVSITKEVLETLLEDEIASGHIELKEIDGLTLENRLKLDETVPSYVMKDIKSCHTLLKGPTTTPSAGDGLKPLESANVTLRKELDLFAGVRPVFIKDKNIDWTFFRENTEGEYALGSAGINISDDISLDFKIISDRGSKRIARAAFEFAKQTGKKKVTVVTKANIIKKSDGRFLDNAKEVAKDYKGIELESVFVDICAANLINSNINSGYSVFLLPNLYGDIITDLAAQIQGGVGTAGSANIGNRYSMFEAVHGSAPKMIEDGLIDYVDPTSILVASKMMLEHIGKNDYAKKLSLCIDNTKKKVNIDGTRNGSTILEYREEILKQIRNI